MQYLKNVITRKKKKKEEEEEESKNQKSPKPFGDLKDKYKIYNSIHQNEKVNAKKLLLFHL